MSDDCDVLRCPYDKNHIIAKTRFQRHLVKCEKNFPSDYMCICPYNATHRFVKSEMQEHINTCSVRKIVEASYIQQPSTHDDDDDDATTISKGFDSRSEIDFLESREGPSEFCTTSSTSNLQDESNACSDAESFAAYRNPMAAQYGRITNHDSDCSSDDSDTDVVSTKTASFGRGRMLSNFEFLRRVGVRGRRN